jgi:hypothetical protein
LYPRPIRAAVAVICAVAAACVATPALAATPEERLAERYAPVVALKEPEAGVPVCSGSTPSRGEHFRPVPVEAVLGNDEVALRGPDGTGTYAQVAPAPTARDLHGKGEAFWLDFPGTAIEPGCDYVAFQERAGEGQPTVAYARVATQPDRPGKLALQYWFYYVFNDYNNKHESDWEMIQLVFDASSAEEALEAEPAEVGYSQHEGAERAGWNDAKLEREGVRPVVYPAAGSHANFYSSRLWLGRSAEEGVGCDDTTGPSQRLQATPILLPAAASGPDDPFAWLAYTGHWGERQKSFNAGPTGPNVKRQWREPITWAEEWRDASLAIPGGSSLGPTGSGFFCGAVAQVSGVVNTFLDSPPAAIALVLVLLALLAIPLVRTRWRPGVTTPLEQRRRGGQVLNVTARLYARWLGPLLLLGVVFIPLSVLGSLLDAADGSFERSGATLRVGGLHTLAVYVATVFVFAATTLYVDARSHGAPIRVAEAWRRTLRRAGTLAWLVVRVTLIALLLAITIVGIPFAIRYLVRAVLSPQACVLEGLSAKDAIARSGRLVRGRFWSVLVFGGLVYLVGTAVGPLAGGILIAATPLPVWLANLVAALIHAFALPFVGVVLTLLFYDRRLAGEAPEAQPAPVPAPA